MKSHHHSAHQGKTIHPLDILPLLDNEFDADVEADESLLLMGPEATLPNDSPFYDEEA